MHELGRVLVVAVPDRVGQGLAQHEVDILLATQAEDYGLVTVEAFAASKAVVTCRDSGGPTELVRDEDNGFVVEPRPAPLAQAIASLADDRTRAERLGANALKQVSQMTWDRVFEQLLLVD